jgi:hypothetical protein
MTNKKQMVERRKHKRFQVQDGGSVVLRAHSIELGQIIDVSRDGLACRYIPSRQPSSGSFELVILLADGSFYLDEIPFRIVSDCETNDDPFSFSTMRRCGVQFGKLTRNQVSQLEYFTRNHAIGGTHVNLSAEVPRQKPPHRVAWT